MNGYGSLNITPPPRHLPLLFEVSRILARHATLDDAMVSALDLMARSTGIRRMVAAITAPDVPGPRIVAVSDLEDRAFVTVPLRMGVWPGGAALQRGCPTTSISPDGARWMELPILLSQSVVGVLGYCEGSGEHTDPEGYAELFRWFALLVSEAVSLRERMSGIASAFCHEEETPHLFPQLPEETEYAGIIGRSAPMREVFSLIDKVAPTEATVLIMGESGTGKELVARAIHERSRRAKGPFVAVNCAALPESVVESELFGHEKGSFTGAHAQRKGRFELASGGTLFLDEIGELPLSVQVKLLRILQERSFERVGGVQTLETDARIVVATNRDLEKEVAEGSFREDLYFRLNIFPIHMPPLRERSSDILLLADRFAAELGVRSGRQIVRISSPAIDLLMTYHWPGNVRELENCIERAVILSSDGVIHAYHLPPSLQSAESTGTGPTTTLDGALARLEKELIIEALKMERGNSAAAARRLAVTERRMGLAMRRFGIDWHRFRTKR